MLYSIVFALAWIILRVFYIFLGGISFEGVENVPLKGPVIITPNHVSDADPPTICLALPRRCWTMAKSELFESRFLGFMIRLFHGFPVKRNSLDFVALRKAEQLLKEGNAILLFPEGECSEDGTLQPMLPGALLLAQRSGSLIVPTALLGTNLIMPYSKLIPRPSWRKTIVRFGPPISPDVLMGGSKGGSAYKLGAARLYAAILSLQQGRPYPDFNDIQLLEKPSEFREKIIRASK